MVWTLLALRPGGSPWISVCGREPANWYVLDLDATVVTCTSRKEDAAGTFKGSFGHMPLSAWVADTRECVAMTPSLSRISAIARSQGHRGHVSTGQVDLARGPDADRALRHRRYDTVR
ncbi:hypothetical protein [Streptomyces sp. NPDC050121]|uniref:hypothetical protein n=1 Tax=Streptomyces sp. NPDC050121 TaxID=3365601 RepID=UPI0037BD940F